MPGFDGLEEAAKTLRKMRDDRLKEEERQAEEMAQQATEKRWINGGATLDEMEEFYQDCRGKFSEAYFSGMPFYVGPSFKDWYMASGSGRPDMSNAIVFGAVLSAVVGRKS